MPIDVTTPLGLTFALTPDLVLIGGAMMLMLWAAWRPDSAQHQRAVGIGALVLTAITAGVVVVFAVREYTTGPGIVAVDAFRWAADLIFLLATFATVALSIDYNAREGIDMGESHVLVLFATAGMMILAAARDLMVIFLGIELMSIAVYVLAGLNRRSPRSAEAAIKYFLLGAFAAGFLLYGIALVYGATGSTNLVTIAERMSQYQLADSPMLLAGIALLLVGFGFKVAAAPFHMWAPDVYEGAPTPVTGYMAVAVKAGAFAAFIRVWLEAFGGAYTQWHTAVWWLAAITMVVGNVVALAQQDMKRMLAYSSIAHSGFVLVALVAGTPAGSSAFLFYLFAYTLATMGAFAVVVAAGKPGEADLTIDSYSGLWNERPWLAAAMTVFMLALLGFPIIGGIGFLGKWYVLQAALEAPAPQARLAVLLVVMTAVSAGYYLQVVRVMYMRPRPATAEPLAPVTGLTRFVIASSAILIIVLGLFPDPIARLAEQGATRPLTAETAAVPQPAQQPQASR
ncbi:MAG TPA: NADH-quinone oxidoreductase subunit N [Gemmatimonadaceae bacterium]|jgi:NADH-quinone oxidoreductase subunit N|nr:NADH-quinone oxidoreductase subunit N [Gemmatimonadaceae bacterium]